MPPRVPSARATTRSWAPLPMAATSSSASSGFAPELFTGIPWGTAQVGDMTRNRMKALALRCWELPVRPDVDRLADLAGLGFGPGQW